MLTKDKIFSVLKGNKVQLQEFGICSIGLFGSYLRNEQSLKSDIDLLIDFAPEKENFDNYMAAYDFFESLFAGVKVEIVTKKGLSRHIGPKILNEVQYV